MPLLACWHPDLGMTVEFFLRESQKGEAQRGGKVPLGTTMEERDGRMGRGGQDTGSRGVEDSKVPPGCGGRGQATWWQCSSWAGFLLSASPPRVTGTSSHHVSERSA